MAQLLNLSLPSKTLLRISSTPSSSSHHLNFAALTLQFRCNGRYTCLFSDNRKQEQARKALESALGENLEKYEKWNKEIKKREEAGGGGSGGGGGWFGWGGRFGWNNDDNFWQEAQQASLAILGLLVLAFGHIPMLDTGTGVRVTYVYSLIVTLIVPSLVVFPIVIDFPLSGYMVQYLVAAKGEQLLAVFINPILFGLRSTRNGLTYITSLITGKSYLGSDARYEEMKLEAVQSSAKERVMKKWASD